LLQNLFQATDRKTLQLTFNAGKTVPDSGKHYFAVYYIKAPDEKKAPRATWADHKGEPEGTKRLYIDFKKESVASEPFQATDRRTLQLTFNAGKTVPDSGKHYFAVYYIKAPDEKKAPRATWADHKGEPEGTKRLYIDFKKVFLSQI
ncbi:hypothetical protein COOONC_08312, partial [Cooperia oncophora]